MILLVLVSLVWAFSFGLIGSTLQHVHPAIVSWLRLSLASLVFVPFTRRIPLPAAARFAAIGALQFGLMYLTYNWAFTFLQGHQIALLTITTPFFISAAEDWQNNSFSPRNALLALLAVAGAAIVTGGRHYELTLHTLVGILLTQVSNICFAIGQIAYRTVCQRTGTHKTYSGDSGIFFYCYLGATLTTLPFAALAWHSTPHLLTQAELLALLYLGIVASGGSFFMWNRGARLVAAGALAVMNNLKIPLAVAVSLLIFHEQANLPRLLAGGAVIIAAAVLSQSKITTK